MPVETSALPGLPTRMSRVDLSGYARTVWAAANVDVVMADRRRRKPDSRSVRVERPPVAATTAENDHAVIDNGRSFNPDRDRGAEL